MTTSTRNRKLTSVGSNPEAILCTVRISAARNAQAGDAKIAAQMASIFILDFWKNKPAIRIQETTNRPVTNQHTNDLPVSREDDKFPHDYNKLYAAHTDI